jgi:4-amino-4-deoxy-L-arabinose transferase-like glycosyltransferase
MGAKPTTEPASQSRASRRRIADLFAVAILAASVLVIYGARLDLQPLVGEETRWAAGAREMLDTGDWIVPRQQGHVFPERPPMTMWAMAFAGRLRGDVDPVAIRLPSVLAVLLTSVVVYAYTRAFASQTAAITAAVAYATMGQVLQIGRLGESEALFALLVSASLLVWHAGYLRGWPPLLIWSAGFGLAALAALVKGPQAPVYFIAITTAYLAVRRDWRYLISWQYAAGATAFFAIVAAWQIPFYAATDWPTVIATWSGLAADRFRFSGVIAHAVTYPLETFVCLLPWSPILLAFAKREIRQMLGDQRPVTVFLFTSILVAYPTVWLAAGARGRYFMPLYPLAAVLVGLVIERCSISECKSYPLRAWQQFLLLWGLIISAGALVVGGSSLLPLDPAHRFYQPRPFALLFALIAASAAYVLWKTYTATIRFPTMSAVIALALVAGTGWAVLMVNINVARWYNPTPVAADFRNLLPIGTNLVSFTPIEHRFAYYYKNHIGELDWPRSMDDLPPNVNYFCFMRHPGDTAESRLAGRGRTNYTTPGTLPFAWQELASICVDRRPKNNTAVYIVLGRVERPLRAEISDVTIPQSLKAQKPDNTAYR